MALPQRMKFGIFMGPFHQLGENPTVAFQRDLELMQWLDFLDYDEAWIGEHHSAGWEIIPTPEIFCAAAAERTKHIKLATGVVSLPYHHPYMVAERAVFLDHLTRGRFILGVGPGALPSDARMLGIAATKLRPRMEESLDIIIRLMTEDEPITHHSDWFTLEEATLQLKPYTHPRVPMGVTAVGSPNGMVLAGRFGLPVLSFIVPRTGGPEMSLSEFWTIAERSAAEHGQAMDRNEWRMVVQCHISDTREQAMAEVKKKLGEFQLHYGFETLGLQRKPGDPPPDPETALERGMKGDTVCVGDPEDMIAFMHRLEERSGGFGGLMIQAQEFATREQVNHSYELISRYVMPHFQGSIRGLQQSRETVVRQSAENASMSQEAVRAARERYQESTSPTTPAGG
jgi:limonene 1,2-monooxygenase